MSLSGRIYQLVFFTLILSSLARAQTPAESSAVSRSQSVLGGGVQNRANVSSPRGAASSVSLGTLTKGLAMYVADTGQAPASGSGFDILLRPPPGVRNWRGPYIALPPGHTLPTDAWDNPYVFINTTVPGSKLFTFQIVSAGPDGQLNTTDDLRING